MTTWDEITLPQNFDKLPIVIVNGCHLMIKNEPHRIRELELYYHAANHLDEYVHKDHLQCTFGQVYFHRFNSGVYKGGTFRGMDFTFGRSNVYFSILIRSVQNINTGEVISGPCNVVKYIL